VVSVGAAAELAEGTMALSWGGAVAALPGWSGTLLAASGYLRTGQSSSSLQYCPSDPSLPLGVEAPISGHRLELQRESVNGSGLGKFRCCFFFQNHEIKFSKLVSKMISFYHPVSGLGVPCSADESSIHYFQLTDQQCLSVTAK
jgi:hypothetical protein